MWRDMYWQDENNMWLQPNPEYVTWYVLTRWKQYVVTTKPWICDVVCTDKMETICGYNKTLNMWRDMYWQDGNNMWLQQNPEYVTWYVLTRWKQYVVTTEPWICDVICTEKDRNNMWLQPNPEYVTLYVLTRGKEYVVTTKPWICDVICTDKIETMWLQPNPEYVTWYVLTRGKQYVVKTKPWICDVIIMDWQDGNNMWLQPNPEYVT